MNRYLPHILLLPLLLLTACIDNNIPLVIPDTSGQTRGTAYLCLTINTPEAGGGTRAEGNHDDHDDGNATLNHGDETEYELYNAYLLLFEQNKDREVWDNDKQQMVFKKGADPDQGSATFCDCFMITDRTQTVPPDQITHISSRYIIRNLALWNFQPDDNKYYFGVILANINPDAVRVNFFNKTFSFRDRYGNFPPENTISRASRFSYGDMKDKMLLPMSAMDAQGDNFLSVTHDDSRYLMMSNAMLFPVGVWGINEAVELTGHIRLEPKYPENYVEDKWPQFYLERIAAKVEVTAAESALQGTLTIGSNTYNYKLNQWCLANVSPNSYTMRHGDWQWDALRSSARPGVNRFTNGTHIEDGRDPELDPSIQRLRRGYFSESTEYLKMTRRGWGSPEQESDFPKVLIKPSDGDPYYKYDLSRITADQHYGGYFFAQHWIPFGTGNHVDYCHENTMKVWRMMVKYATHVVVEVQFWKDTLGEDIEVGGNIIYAEGKSYYILPISHFGNEYTPWRGGETPLPETIEKSYPDDKDERLAKEINDIQQSYPRCRTWGYDYTSTKDHEGHMSSADGNYLGRWAVVRNTWYKLNITSVDGLGLNSDPVKNHSIITNDPTPLDCYESNLTYTVKVNDWGVRDQDVTLQ